MVQLKRVSGKDTKPERVAALEVHIGNIYAQYRHLLPADYRWEDEHSRWNELVYCIFAELTDHSYMDARSLTDKIFGLNLLELDDLADVQIMEDGKADPNNPRIRTVSEILSINGIEQSDIDKSLSAIC
ncbi:MAG: hypothetical protein C5S46_03090, partial [Candidatus Methanomarinus sp.]